MMDPELLKLGCTGLEPLRPLRVLCSFIPAVRRTTINLSRYFGRSGARV